MTSIFKSNDIRGIYPSELNEDIAYKIGRAFVTFLNVKQVIIGRDARLSSPKLFEALAKGIVDQGADVIDIGLCSTPMFYFASAKAAIMVTASHLTKEYNGFKMFRENVSPVDENSGIKEIQQLIEQNKFKEAKKGKIIKKDILAEYINHCLKFLKTPKKLKIVLDAGNGMCGYTFPKIFEKIKNVELIEQYCDVDFSFPHHTPNPLKFETLKDLQKMVKDEKADFGIATDGDGDRCTFVDEKGEIIPSDFTVALIAQQVLKKHPGAKILYDLRCSKVVKEEIEKSGGKAILCRVGHSFFKEKMRKEKAVFGGELSGHMYYKENANAENSFITAAFIMNLLSEKNVHLSTLVKPLRKYYGSGEINFEVNGKDAKMKDVEEKYEKEAIKVIYFDGLSMYFKDWWFNLRKSRSEDLLRLVIEADSKGILEKRKGELIRLFS